MTASPESRAESIPARAWAVVWPTFGLLLASISVALYYNIVFFGQAVSPLISFPVTGGCLFYYLAAFNNTPPAAQVLLWIASLVISGWLWWAALWGVWRLLLKSPLPSEACRGLKALPLLYALPLPWLLWIHAQSRHGSSWKAFRDAVLVRDELYWNSQGHGPYLQAVFFFLGLLETGVTAGILGSTSDGLGAKTIFGILLAGAGSTAALCCLAELASSMH